MSIEATTVTEPNTVYLRHEENSWCQAKDPSPSSPEAHRGLGKALVQELFQRGATKVYATARELKDPQDPRVVNVVLDVTDSESVAALAAAAPDATIVINNAGTNGAHRLLTSHTNDIRAVFETNYFGAVRIAQAFAPILADNGGVCCCPSSMRRELVADQMAAFESP
jgi:NAD(P)-dependent dehydrogenase (short-subunit alcohol dehydrogenase family)